MPKSYLRALLFIFKFQKKVEQETFKGTVKFFNNKKGFGFIKQDETNEEVFVHVTGLVDKIQENDRVSFQKAEGRKGMNAINVTIIRES